METEFTSSQKEYLSGFFAAVSQRWQSPFVGQTDEGRFTATPNGTLANLAEEETYFGTPVDELCKEEQIKRELNGLDCYDRIEKAAANATMVEGGDVFRFKYYGLFNVSPAQKGYMLRCRIPGGILTSNQLEGLAEIAEDWAGGYSDITTRANLQFREIFPANTVKTLNKLVDLGLTSRGAGADNLRNITCSPTAGFDPEEIFDTRSLAKAMHHCILNSRDLYGLPRKFNISFDGGGSVSVCADTNDIAFYAVRIGEGHEVEPGVYFRVQLAGITGHKQFAFDSGILLKPEQCVAVAAAMVRVFIENGDRTNRKKARLKYLIDQWGLERFLDETRQKLDFELPAFPLSDCVGRGPVKRRAHIGIHPQTGEYKSYIGVVVPVGRMKPEQMKRIASIARKFGQGEVRLTVWQNLLIPHIGNGDRESVCSELLDAGLHYEAKSISGGLVACTGNAGCKYAAANTKRHAVELADFLGERFDLDEPINLHLTGCPHSCAQHYVGDIGLQATKVKVGDESVEGYSVVVGGGVDDQQAIAKELFKGIAFEQIKPLLKNILERYLENRSEKEHFFEFNRERSVEELRSLYALPEIEPRGAISK